MPEVITDHLDLWASALLSKSTTGRGSNSKLEAYGIKKLRELILELAARGKLVPQDENDEPASVLLEKIEKEKARLNKERRIRKQDKQPGFADSEKPLYVPSGWEWARLGDVVEVVRGITFPASEKSKVPEEGRVACLRTTNVQDRIEWDDLLYVRREFVTRGEQFVRDSDIVMSTANSRELVGKVAIVKEKPEFHTAFGGFLTVLRPILLDPAYIMVLLRTPVSRNALIDSASQTTNIANISIGKLNSLALVIPPLAEQHRIVTKVDELMALCDQLEQQQTDSLAAHEALVEALLGALTRVESQQEFSAAWARIASHFDTLFTTEASIDQLKQTILQLAVMGKLVPQDPNDEPADFYLKRVAKEKQSLSEAKKIQKPKKLPSIDDDEMPFQLPNGWKWAYVWDVAKLITSGSRDWSKYYSNSGALFVTMGNLSRGEYKLRLDFLRYVNPPADGEGSRTRLEAKDLLISITGDVGNLGLIPEEFGEAYINQHTCLLRFMPDCQSRYFPELMRSPWAKYQFDAPQRGVKNSFRLSDVGEMLIPVPPVAEQDRIVTKIDELMDLFDALKAHLADAQTTQLHLADAIVEQAVC